ncbi:Altered inheritance of mitochondria protein 32 [Mycena venus]|uniref:Altered inheritance of mitochondria protein 32 n=1 Tax=Mycena venus TaxID=2733690 RepID=A0A8H6Y488_9AGAR|nr:Altered inheritance of mitochondria protein 32 [Mycena venus]
MSLWKLRALVLGQDQPPNNIYTALTASGIPVAAADCRTCPNPCDEGHSEYPRRFSVDLESPMLGTVKPFRRQASGQCIWSAGRLLTNAPQAARTGIATLPTRMDPSQRCYRKLTHRKCPTLLPLSPLTWATRRSYLRSPGVFSSTDSTRLSILNGSHKTVCADDDHETVIVLPDYSVVAGVPKTLDGAKELWRTALDSGLPRMGITEETSSFQTWILPYSCVIMLCSHKRRDNRCAIAAPKLEHAFIECLQRKGWTADTQLEHIVEPPLETFSGTAEEKAAYITDELKDLPSAKKALIIKNSHMGGHKYAGNCIIYTPQGSSVWYGRVTTHEVESIVVNTIERGLVLPPLLRGGMDLSRLPGCPTTLHDW